jgi:hypothetical protein
MSVSTPDFWNLLRQSRLLTAEQIDSLGKEYAQLNGAAQQGNAKTLSLWLVSRKALSNYQATILLAGRSGPFHYGQYLVYDRVESGRLGGLFRACHAATRHPVLLQFAAGAALSDAGLWRLTAASAASHEAIVHPQLNRCFETVDLGSFKFAAVEDLRGESLETQLARGPLPPAEACRIARCAALALSQLHMEGIVHGDVRPHNLWLEPTGNVKLLRDPLALPGTLAQLQQLAPEKIAARADYVAPELAQPGTKPDALSDLYALGCTLYQLLAGRAPFAGGDPAAKPQRHASEPIQPLERQGVPQPIAQIVTYLMAKNASVRYQQAMVVAEQLAPYCDPARLLVQPPAPPQTLAAYESHLQSLAAPPGAQAFGAALPAGASAPAINSGAAASGPPLVTADDPRRRAIRRPAGARLSDAVQNPKSLLTRQNIIYLASGLTTLILLLVGGIMIASMAGNRNGKPGDDADVASGTDDDASGSQTGGADGSQTGSADGKTDGTTDGNSDGGSSTNSGTAGAAPRVLDQDVVRDDGKLLWASPTSGGPISLDYTPAGSKVYLMVRPAEIAASGEGGRVLQALGPNFAALRSRWETASGYKLEEIEQLIVTLHGGEAAELRPAFVVRPKPPVSRDELLRRWGNPAETISGGERYFKANGWAFYLPPGGDGRVFTMAAEPEIADVIEKRGVAVLDPNTARMLKTADAQRHVNLLLDPFLVNNEQGERLFAGPAGKLRPAISWLIGEDVKSSLVSMHFGRSFYLELRVSASGAQDRIDAAQGLEQRIDGVPDAVRQYLTTINVDPYWSKLSYQLVPMFGWLRDYARVGAEGDDAVANVLLPEQAASNLVLASELLISSAPGAGPAVAVAGPTRKTPQTLDELLMAKTSIEFAQHDLINAVALVKQDLVDTYSDLPFTFDVKMMGSHLMEEGITQNQSVRDFNHKDKTVAEILTAMMMKANPVPTVKLPTEDDQKIIWVIAPDAAGSSTKTILITTRKAAMREGYTIPKVFSP